MRRSETSDDEPALLSAAKAGDEVRVKELLSAGANVNAKDTLGYTALMRAADAARPRVIKLLIASHAKVNTSNKYGFTALMLAADQGCRDSVGVLVAAGADVNARSKAGFTSIYMALRHVCENEQRCATTKSIIELLISKGADVNAETKDGETALMAASALGNLTAVNLLFGAGADVNKRNSSGQTALCLATREDHEEVAARLRSFGAEGCSSGRVRAPVRLGIRRDSGSDVRSAASAGGGLQNQIGPYSIGNGLTQGERSRLVAEIREFLWTHWKQRQSARVDARFYTLEGDPTANTYLIGLDESGAWRVSVQSVSLVSALLPRRARPRRFVTKLTFDAIERIDVGSGNPATSVAISDTESRQPASYWLRLRNTRTSSIVIF